MEYIYKEITSVGQAELIHDPVGNTVNSGYTGENIYSCLACSLYSDGFIRDECFDIHSN